MNFTYWVTEDCNLKCSYCYVNKVPKTMDQETAARAIEFTEKILAANPARQKDKLCISLHGGEPLLNYPVIRYIIEAFQSKYPGNTAFTMTTNGTTPNNEILDYLASHVELTVSVDGNQDSHDRNRVYGNGQGSFRRVMKTIEYLNSKSYFYRVRMTITPNNVSDFADNYIYLYEKGCKIVAFALDESDPDWNKELMDIYQRNLNNIFTYMISRDLTNAQYCLHNFKNEYFRRRSTCDGCHTSYNIASDGSIYPCILAVGHGDFVMGNVHTGLNEAKLAELDTINQKDEGVCSSCAMYSNCRSKTCKIINKIQTGNYYMSSPIFCTAQKIHYSTVKNHDYILDGFAVSAK